jgi:hypothetical protein
VLLATTTLVFSDLEYSVVRAIPENETLLILCQLHSQKYPLTSFRGGVIKGA